MRWICTGRLPAWPSPRSGRPPTPGAPQLPAPLPTPGGPLVGTIILFIKLLAHHKINFMPNPRTDNEGFSTSNADNERDMAAKGGPTTTPGRADGKHGVSAPYD